MMHRWQAVICCTSLALLASCAGGNKLEKQRLDCSERITKALELYKNKKYASVVFRLEDARTQCSGSPVMDTVLYYLGMANLQDKKFIEARTEFQRLVQDFPGSPFFHEAKFRIGYAVYCQAHPINRDQKETHEAIRLFDNFIEVFPKSQFADSAQFYRTEAYEKLALKEFNNSAFYVMAKEPESAVVYYKTFISQFSDSRLVDQARFNIIDLLVKLNRTTEAVEVCDELLREGKNRDLQKAANLLTLKYRKKTPEAEQ